MTITPLQIELTGCAKNKKRALATSNPSRVPSFGVRFCEVDGAIMPPPYSLIDRTLKMHVLNIVKVIIVCTLLSACSQDQPAIWRVETNDVALFLAGSLHYVNPSTDWSVTRFDEIASEMNELILEINSSTDSSELDFFIQNHGTSQKPNGLQDHLSPSVYQDFSDRYHKISQVKKTKHLETPWYALLKYVARRNLRDGLSPKYGLENYILQKAEDLHVEVSGLETVTFQLEELAFLSNADPDSLFELEFKTENSTHKLESAWARGDVQTIFEVLFQYEDEYPLLFDRLISKRNKQWARQLSEILKNGSGTKLVVVGVGHMVGRNSVIELLKQEGFLVTRLD